MEIRAQRFDGCPDLAGALALLERIGRGPFVAEGRRVDKPLVLYGAGNLGKLAWDYFKAIGIPVTAVVDGNPAAHAADPFWQGVEIHSPAGAPQALKDGAMLAICIGTHAYAGVVAPLHAAGWRDTVPFYAISACYTDRHPLNNGWFAGELDKAELAEVARVLADYGDDVSRAHHLQFLAWHALHAEWSFSGAPIDTGNRYFIPEMTARLTPAERFADLGAHHGDVVLRLMALTGGVESVEAVEPDPVNAAILRQRLGHLGDRLRLHPCALGRQAGEAVFHTGLDYASRLSATGKDRVAVRTLDSLGLAPSFIKAHLEGAEMDALLGGLDTIRRHRPLLALTVYHNRLGLWEAQRRLMDALDGYRFLFRAHNWLGTGAVVYGLPD